MIEYEQQLSCQKHNQPIQMVIFDKKIKRQERLLCSICLETFESNTKMVGFKKVFQMIEENQKNKEDNIQRLIKVDIDLVEQFTNELKQIKQSFIKQLDDLISNTSDWIKSLNQIVTINLQYSFHDKLEELISKSQENTFNQEKIIDQTSQINNSFVTKMNLKLSNLKNLEQYSQCEKSLQNLNLSHHLRLIDNSTREIDTCYAISFNFSGQLMISASNCNIKVWDFVQGRLKQITMLKGHDDTISCLQFSQMSNSFVSAGFDNSIICWKQINEKEWRISQSYQSHTKCIDSLILNQSEKELISCGRDRSIKVWQIDFIKNQLTYLYQLNQHKNDVLSLCYNQSENTLVSCGYGNQILIWKKDIQQKWQFANEVTQTVQGSGCRLCFINDYQFIWVAGIQESNDCISIFELKDGCYRENLEKEVQLITNDQNYDFNFYPICFNKEKRLMIVKHKCHVYLIRISNEGQLKIVTQIQYESNSIQGALSKDGRYLVNWNKATRNFDIFEILNN